MKNEMNLPQLFKLSLLLGFPFVAGWLSFTAMSAQDGREPVTDWLDPMLAGLTLLTILCVQVVLICVWSHLKDSPWKKWIAWSLMGSQWFYIFGETLSNTITIGEPPQDIGSLFEITAGAILLLTSVALIVLYLGSQTRNAQVKKPNLALTLLALSLLVGMAWWFTHPIDQSKPGAPKYIPGNPVFNIFHNNGNI